MKEQKKPRSVLRWVLNIIYIVFLLVIISGVLLGPVCPPDCPRRGGQSIAMQTSRSVGLELFQYAEEHNGHYPEGKTSTEIFQRLIDEKYVSDPSIFYIAMPGKIRPETNQLKTENVSWDVTSGVDSSSPEGLPVIFLTGFKITYEAGSRAIPTGKDSKPFIAVYYKSNSARAIPADSDGSIPNFIPADFKTDGKAYRQLTP